MKARDLSKIHGKTLISMDRGKKKKDRMDGILKAKLSTLVKVNQFTINDDFFSKKMR